MQNAGNLKSLERLEVIRTLNGANREWVNDDLYRLMLRKDMYVLAYERLKSIPGNMTPGTDDETLDGFSEEEIGKIIAQMKDESYQCRPVRESFIPKANGKLRRLGIPCPRDKIVQEVVRIILEAVYDSPHGPYFSEHSYGFRRGKSVHGALKEVQKKWSGVIWLVEGDIQSCFDDIDHHTLVDVLRKKIKDERFIALIWKFLKAGYQDLERARHDSLAGTPQGGIASPILANIYLHELDAFVERLQAELEKGRQRRPNHEYELISDRRYRLAKAGKAVTEEFRRLGTQMRNLPSLDTRDPNFVRIKYVRYADDWLIGVIGSHELAEEIKNRVGEFLKDKLALTLSQDKTRITNARTEEAEFLGYRIRRGRARDSQKVTASTNGSGRRFKRRSTGMEVVLKAPMDRLIKRLASKGFCDGKGVPKHKAGWTVLDEDQIISLYSSINRGIQQFYRPADNWPQLQRVQYILKYSLAKTLALKVRVSITRVMKARDIGVRVTNKNGQVRNVAFFRNTDWTVKRDAFKDSPEIDLVRMNVRLRTRSKLGLPCVVCGDPNRVQMHHVRHIRKFEDGAPRGFTRVMAALNRKQVPVCKACHEMIHRGQYDGLSLKDLAYDLRKVRFLFDGPEVAPVAKSKDLDLIPVTS
ncbi:MAG: reverse transcriptase domain-containing protein [Ktedonobacteraceae bacterium]